MLTPNEEKFLLTLRDEYGPGNRAVCKTNPPAAKLQSFVDRGYCTLSRARSGPLGVYTGEVIIDLSEAGRAAIVEKKTVAG